MIGLTTPNFSQMGMEAMPQGTGRVQPYGSNPPQVNAPSLGVASMQGPATPGGMPSAYQPAAGRADRLGANIVGGM